MGRSRAYRSNFRIKFYLRAKRVNQKIQKLFFCHFLTFYVYLSWIMTKKSKKVRFLIWHISLLARRATYVARASARTQVVIDRRDFAWFSKTKKNLKTNIILDQMVHSKDEKADYSNQYAKRDALKSESRRNSKFYAWGLLFNTL